MQPSDQIVSRMQGYSRGLGSTLMQTILTSKLLVVGAGGIGCELLKNLVLSGFQTIHIIDLDTIDTSNLNRQFLFQKQHVGKSKALVAREAALKYNPEANITAYHANIKDQDFNCTFVGQFALVLNALDNLSARRHVNRLCLAANVPLIESGTAGYLGQVQLIKKGETECFECNPHPTPKTFPICTIRNTPSTPIHCIVWAKYIFERFFGPSEEDAEDDNRAKVDNEDGKDLSPEEQIEVERLAKMIKDDEATLQVEKQKSFGRWLFHKLFHSDILYISTLKSLWKTAPPPTPIALDPLADTLPESLAGLESFPNNLGQSESLIPDQRIWSPQQNLQKFIETANHLATATNKENWDKDNPLHLDFATAASNLRAFVFKIELSSRFSVKEKAGNIIPAIATTNAIVAGFIVMKAFRLLDNKQNLNRHTYLKQKPDGRGQLFLPVSMDPPNPKCYVCGTSTVTLQIDTKSTLLGKFNEEILNKSLNVVTPSIMIGSALIFEAGFEPEDEEYAIYQPKLALPLSSLKIGHDTILYITDMASNCVINIQIQQRDHFESPDAWFQLGDLSSLPPPEAAQETNLPPEEEDCLIIEDAPPRPSESQTQKRPLAGESEDAPPLKKQKTG